MSIRLVCAALLALAAASSEGAESYPRRWQPVALPGAELTPLLGRRIDSIAALHCDAQGCRPIPFQIDERTADGQWALGNGAAPNADESPGVLDEHDEAVFLVDDAGDSAPTAARRAGAVLEVEIDDPLGFPPRYVYLAADSEIGRGSLPGYVAYDATADLLFGRVTLGFADGIPQFLALAAGGENVLDRLKIRATATFLWGLIRITRSEEDLVPEPVTWGGGPVRVIRRQPLQIRMRFGIRSPRFTSTTLFYRDFAELPLAIRLRVPPRYFFTSIHVEGGLDFRDLPGTWHARLPGSDTLLPAGRSAGFAQRSGVAGDWFALEGEPLTIVQRLRRGASLESVREESWYLNGARDDPPENDAGGWPAAGYVLDDWDGVEGGVHTLTSTSYAIPPDLDVGVFLATVDTPLHVAIHPLRPARPAP